MFISCTGGEKTLEQSRLKTDPRELFVESYQHKQDVMTMRKSVSSKENLPWNWFIHFSYTLSHKTCGREQVHRLEKNCHLIPSKWEQIICLGFLLWTRFEEVVGEGDTLEKTGKFLTATSFVTPCEVSFSMFLVEASSINNTVLLSYLRASLTVFDEFVHEGGN